MVLLSGASWSSSSAAHLSLPTKAQISDRTTPCSHTPTLTCVNFLSIQKAKFWPLSCKSSSLRPNSFRKVFRGDVNQIYLRVESLPLAPPKDLLEEKVDDVYRQTIVVNVVPAPLSHIANELPFSVPLDSWESNEYVAGVLRKIYACITQARVECYSIHY